MSAKHDEAARIQIQLLTGAYWNRAQVSGLDSKSASLGLRFGMAVMLRHPEYAQAYLHLTRLPIADPFEDVTAQQFIEAVPLEIENVVPSGE